MQRYSDFVTTMSIINIFYSNKIFRLIKKFEKKYESLPPLSMYIETIPQLQYYEIYNKCIFTMTHNQYKRLRKTTTNSNDRVQTSQLGNNSQHRTNSSCQKVSTLNSATILIIVI